MKKIPLPKAVLYKMHKDKIMGHFFCCHYVFRLTQTWLVWSSLQNVRQAL